MKKREDPRKAVKNCRIPFKGRIITGHDLFNCAARRNHLEKWLVSYIAEGGIRITRESDFQISDWLDSAWAASRQAAKAHNMALTRKLRREL